MSADPLRGDLVEVRWVDIHEMPVGDPDDPSIARRTSTAYFWGWAEYKGVPILVTTSTMDEEVEGQNGYCAYPKGCVLSLKVVKRARRARRKSEEKKDPGPIVD